MCVWNPITSEMKEGIRNLTLKDCPPLDTWVWVTREYAEGYIGVVMAMLRLECYTEDGFQHGWYDTTGIRMMSFCDDRIKAWALIKLPKPYGIEEV